MKKLNWEKIIIKAIRINLIIFVILRLLLWMGVRF